MKKVWFLFLMLVLQAGLASAQLYRYLNTQSGLSSQRVISIGKDNKGYMWFLTHEGIDRFNGSEFKHYYLSDKGRHVQQMSNLNKIYTDSKGNIWSIGKNGYLFKYNAEADRFDLIFNFTENEYRQELLPLSIAQIDRNDQIWLCALSEIYLYNIKTKKMIHISHDMKGEFKALTQVSDSTYYLATSQQIFHIKIQDEQLQSTPIPLTQKINNIEKMRYQPDNKVLVIHSQSSGIVLYHPESQEVNYTRYLEGIYLNEMSTNQNYPNEVIIATNGEGIFRLNTQTKEIQHFRALTKEDTHSMSGDIITDVFIDEMQRIWMGVYPYGVTFYSNTEPTYQWISTPPKSMSFRYSNHVNQVIEDHEGDLWIATNKSVYLFDRETHEWTDMLSSVLNSNSQKHIFLTLCEHQPGKILVGGYMPGAYYINKRTRANIYYPEIKSLVNDSPDKYIRSFYLSNDSLLWVGGNNNLKCINVLNGQVEGYPVKYPITYITAKNEDELWLGTLNGLYIFKQKTKEFKTEPRALQLGCINTIYQSSGKMTYFGTNGTGLWTYDSSSKELTNFNTLNSILSSNNIYSILPDDNEEDLILNTEKELMIFRPKQNFFAHWAQERILLPERFNTAAGLHTHDGQNIFVCSQGIIRLKQSYKDTRTFLSKMVLSDFTIENGSAKEGQKRTVRYPNLDNYKRIDLTHEENTFSMEISSINYDCPSRVQYSWKLIGYDQNWTPMSKIHRISYSHLPPGRYLLNIRSIHEDYKYVIQNRYLLINIKPPYYQTLLAYLCYLASIIAIAILILNLLSLRRKSAISKEKIQFFINTAHDIRTPLTLIKAPLSQIANAKNLSQENTRNLEAAIKNTDNLTRLVNQLIEFQKEDLYTSATYVSLCEMRSYINGRLKKFKAYTEQKNIELTLVCNFKKFSTWIDMNKMDSILNNLISNAIKYTPNGGKITLTVKSQAKNWEMSIADTGIGISAKDQRKLFKYHFRGDNAINQKITGCGIGMLQTYQLVKRHAGHITVNSIENKGTTFTLTFPIKSKSYKYQKNSTPTIKKELPPMLNLTEVESLKEEENQPSNKPYLLIVEDNAELRQFLCHALSNTYQVKEAVDGMEALDMIQEHQPDIILSDIMMPVLRGDELCRKIKNDVATSHIAVILLTALDDKENMLKGLSYKADSYLMKPFDLEILKGTIASIWANKLIVRERFSQLNYDAKDLEPQLPGLDLDQQFLTKATDIIKQTMEEEFNVDDLCDKLHLSRTSLYTKIKALTNYSPIEFIRRIRLEEAARLLKTHQYSVSEVADKVGYGNPKYFTDLFKKHFGVTPSAYMKEETEQ